jgi:hypothetical protein
MPLDMNAGELQLGRFALSDVTFHVGLKREIRWRLRVALWFLKAGCRIGGFRYCEEEDRDDNS